MSVKGYNIKLDTLCKTLQLGKMVNKAEPIPGGLLHKMFRVETHSDIFAVKALNPNIISRPDALQNYIRAERFAQSLAVKIPSLPAKEWDGTTLHEIDQQMYQVFDWVDGKSLTSNEILPKHAEMIGGILADIHNNDFESHHLHITHVEVVDWHQYLRIGLEKEAEWTSLLSDYMEELILWNHEAVKASKALSGQQVMSHRDLDPKNVLWRSEFSPIIIDWESAGMINPSLDVIETAVYWATDRGNIDQDRFLAFLDGYKRIRGEINADWENVLSLGFQSKLAWLEYSLKRSLGIECADEAEQKLGTDEVIGTIGELKGYTDRIPKLVAWLKS